MRIFLFLLAVGEVAATQMLMLLAVAALEPFFTEQLFLT